MAVVTSTTIQTLFNNFKALYLRGLQKSGDWPKVASEFKSSGSGNIYSWLGAFPMLRKWVGNRVIENMKESDYTLKNDSYEATVGVKRTDIEDDNLGIYGPMFEQMGVSANEHIDINVFKALVDGFTELCYDGKPFFSKDHPINSKEDGSGTSSTFTNIVNDTVTTKPAWFLLDARKVIKPILYQNRQDARLQTVTNPANDTVFMKDEYLYGVDARRAFGYSFPQLAVACRDDLSEVNFNKAYALLEGMKLDGNRPMNTRGSILVVPTSLRSAAEDILEKQNKANGESNVNYHRVELLVTPFAEAVAVVTPDPDDSDDDSDSEQGTETSGGSEQTGAGSGTGQTESGSYPESSGQDE